jgi:hypothetical protein
MTEGEGGLVREDVFSALPARLRRELVGSFSEIVKNFAERRWEPAELNGGKLCEVAYCVVKGMADGKLPTRAAKPKNMVDACRALESQSGPPRSVRIQIPRMIVALYEVRNNRNVGHVGGDVDPNHMDAVCVLQMSKWIVAELIRVLHEQPVDEAAALVDAVVEREVPLVWKVGDKMRVLDPNLSYKDTTMILLHAVAGSVKESDLFAWTEHSNASVYRRDILRKEHKGRLLEYDEEEGTVELSPRGIEYAEGLLVEGD